MLYATTKSGHTISGHVSDSIDSLTVNLNNCYSSIEEVQADGHELYKCCEILGRKLPSSRVYTFLGGNAQEIAKYWGPK